MKKLLLSLALIFSLSSFSQNFYKVDKVDNKVKTGSFVVVNIGYDNDSDSTLTISVPGYSKIFTNVSVGDFMEDHYTAYSSGRKFVIYFNGDYKNITQIKVFKGSKLKLDIKTKVSY